MNCLCPKSQNRQKNKISKNKKREERRTIIIVMHTKLLCIKHRTDHISLTIENHIKFQHEITII